MTAPLIDVLNSVFVLMLLIIPCLAVSDIIMIYFRRWMTSLTNVRKTTLLLYHSKYFYTTRLPKSKY